MKILMINWYKDQFVGFYVIFALFLDEYHGITIRFDRSATYLKFWNIEVDFPQLMIICNKLCGPY
jgi:hypothetical protein